MNFLTEGTDLRWYDIVDIEGKLKSREYVDKKDIKRYVTEIYVEKVKMISKKANRNPSN